MIGAADLSFVGRKAFSPTPQYRARYALQPPSHAALAAAMSSKDFPKRLDKFREQHAGPPVPYSTLRDEDGMLYMFPKNLSSTQS